jgi:hypothetical protein
LQCVDRLRGVAQQVVHLLDPEVHVLSSGDVRLLAYAQLREGARRLARAMVERPKNDTASRELSLGFDEEEGCGAERQKRSCAQSQSRRT